MQPPMFNVYANPMRNDVDMLGDGSITISDIHDEDDVRGFEPTRFIAGDRFFNYELYGSLRKGVAQHFFSGQSLGIQAAVFVSSLSLNCINDIVQPIFFAYLHLTPQKRLAAQGIVNLPGSFGFVFGFMSDCCPFLGLRRKAYFLIGLIMNAVSILTMAGLTRHLETVNIEDAIPDSTVAVGITMAAIGTCGSIIMHLNIHTHVIELSQRESLARRGSFLAAYLVFRRLISMVATLFTYVTVGSDLKEPFNVSAAVTMLLLVVVSIIPLPAILCCWKEEQSDISTSIKIQGPIVWKMLQQKAVWRILAFICFFTFFLNVEFEYAANVIAMWSNAVNDNTLLLTVVQDVIWMLTILCWRVGFMNADWRGFFSWCPLFIIGPPLLMSTLVTTNAIRDHYLYRCMMSISYISAGIYDLTNLVPLTEIVQEGTEAVIVGMVFSLQNLMNNFVETSSRNGLFSAVNFYDPEEVAEDTSTVRRSVFLTLLLNYGINALALIGLFFLPAQKLDAQQMRMYGGYTKAAAVMILILGLSLFFFSESINVMTFVPAWSCYQIAGGDGC